MSKLLRRIAVLVVFGTFLSTSAFAERPAQVRSVRISGLQGRTNVAPDRTKLTATFTGTAKDATKARVAATKQARKLQATLQALLGTKGTVKLAPPQIQSHYSWNGSTQKATVTQNVEIEFQGRSMVLAAKLFDSARKAGANQVSSPQGVISPTKLERTANQAVGTAIRQGIRMSRSAATAAGGRAGRVQTVSATAYPSWTGNSVRSHVSVEARLNDRR